MQEIGVPWSGLSHDCKSEDDVSVTSASAGCHSSFIRHCNSGYPRNSFTVFYLRPFILAIPSAFLVYKYMLMHFDRILKTNKVGARKMAYSLVKALGLEELELAFGSPESV